MSVTSDADDEIAAALKAADAERLDALERLAGGIAHDFRNILAVIKGNVELAMRRTDDPRISSLLIEAERAAALGADMTEQLLAFAQRRRSPSALLDVAAVVRGCAPLLRAACGPHVTLEIEGTTTAALAAIDRSDLQRVLINL